MMTNNEIQYKAYRFLMEVDKTTFAYGVKGVRAMWDPSLSIPGTDRRGGWRCPVGTRYGGQITDRFGRNCGWGVARRIANAITNIGERLENVDDRRRGRRVAKRNRRMLGRLQRNAESGRAERGLRGIADRLDGGEGGTAETLTPSGTPDTPSLTPPGTTPDVPGTTPADATPPAKPRRVRNPRKPPGQLGRGWRGVLDPNGRRYWERDNRGWFDGSDAYVDVPEGDAPDTPSGGRTEPTRPGAGRRRRREVVIEDDLGGRRRPDGRGREVVIEDDFGDRVGPGGRGREAIEDIFGEGYNPPKRDGKVDGEIVYRDGKPYVWRENPNAGMIGAGPQSAGFWTQATNVDLEKERIDKKRLRNRDGKKPKGAPTPDRSALKGNRYRWRDEEGDEWEYDPNSDRWNLIGNVRKMDEAKKKDKEDRKKNDERLRKRNEQRQRKPQGEAEAAPARPPRRPPFDSDARDAGLRESERRRVRREIEEPGAPRTEEGDTPQAEEKPKPRKPRKRRVEASEQRAQESATRKPAGEVAPAGTQKKPTERIDLTKDMVELELAPGESAPDERSFRNVNNRFPKKGLPENAYWRDASYDGNDKYELERRFGRYYDGENNINNRGKVVNQELKRRRGGEAKPKTPPKEVAPAETQKKPDGQIDLTEDLVELDLPPDESIPDERSYRNVNNRFPKNGLPKTAYWREQDFPEGEEKAELERRFGRYYGADNNINTRGKFVNQELKRRRDAGEIKPPRGRPKPSKPAPKPEKPQDAKPNFDLPKEPPLPPFMPGTQLDGEVRKAMKALDDVKRIAQDIDREEKDFPNLFERPWWRDAQGNGLNDEDRAKIEAALGQFYGRDGKLNDRGRQVFNEIANLRKNDLVPESTPKAPQNAVDAKVPDATEAGKQIGQDDNAPVPLENIIPEGGELGGETRDQYRKRVKAQLEAKIKDNDRFVDAIIRNYNYDEIRERANAARQAQEQWKNGYDAAKSLLEAALQKHEGKRLDGLSLKEQAELKRLMKNVDDHAIELNALEKYAEKLEQEAAKAPQPPGAGGDVDAEFDGLGDIIAAEPSPVRRPYGPRRITNYDDAVKAIHEGGQNASIDDVADGVIVDAMIDEGMVYVGRSGDVRDGEKTLTKEDLQTKGFSHFLYEGGQLENRRFTFKLIKSDNNDDPLDGNGVWDVVKVVDKKTGETWFLKATVYGHNGGMLEGIGMRAAEALQLGNDRAHLRIGKPIVDEATGKTHRWMMMRGIMDWNHPVGVEPQQSWQDVKRMNWGDAEKISPEDAARIAVLDFIFKNNDRHGGNFMYTVDQNGNVRLGLIDHGLIGYGRGAQGVDERDTKPLNQQQWDAEVVKHRRKLNAAGVNGYGGEPNNGIQGLKNLGFKHKTPANRERFGRIVQRSIRVLEKQLETILSQQELEKAGMKLTPEEKIHLDALRTIVQERLEYLRAHADDLVRVFN